MNVDRLIVPLTRRRVRKMGVAAGETISSSPRVHRPLQLKNGLW